MAGARKHGANRYMLSIQAGAAGSAADVQDMMSYDAFAEGGVTYSAPAAGYDMTSEEIFEASFVCYATLTGQATNFVSLGMSLTRAGSTVNDIRVVFSSSGVVGTAFIPFNMAVASGATTAGGGVLLVSTGIALPWTLQPGDVLAAYRLSNNSTGLATPTFALTFLTRQKGA